MTFMSAEEFGEYGKAAELRELREVEAVVEDDDLKDAGALVVVEAEEVHGGEIHTHELTDMSCLIGLQKVAMEWRMGAEGGCT